MKMIEYEIKVLDINIDEVQSILKQKAFKEEETLHFKRYVFDTIPASEAAWVRLRTDGKTSTLTYKQSVKDSIDGVVEIEVGVDDFEQTRKFLEKTGLRSKVYQENRRTIYRKGNVEASIDYWPHIPPYMEIEGKNKREVEKTLETLGLATHRTTSLPTAAVYELYNVNIDSYKKLKF
jgi:adenylate cyclase class 2